MLTFDETVRNLEARGVMPKTPPSLYKTSEAMKRLLVDVNPSKVVLIAGTNGKGSVAKTLETLLFKSHQRVGLYTSPHLVKTTERIRINDKDISEKDFCLLYEEMAELTLDLNLTHFEILTLMALNAFLKNDLDWMIFEVGLGGIWDATNAIPHSFSVITNISKDHEAILGNSLIEIAKNKFGIIQENQKVFLGNMPHEIQTLIQEKKSTRETQWIQIEKFESSFKNGNFFLKMKWGEHPLNIPGRRGAENSALALCIFQELGFDPRGGMEFLKEVNWPGRMEKLDSPDSPCPVYLSGDHNPAGIESLLELLAHYPRQHLYIIAGVGSNKDLDRILEPLASLPHSSLHLTETPFKGLKIQEYGKWQRRANSVGANPRALLEGLYEKAQPQDMVLITGSIYLVGLFLSPNRQN